MPATMARATYGDMCGPTTGDRVRLADTELFIAVERDLTTHGEEVKFGGGKVIRDGMGQSQVTRADGAADTGITNALIVDVNGMFKADVVREDGRIAAIGKAGNPDTQPGVDIVIGPGTFVSAAAQADRMGGALGLRIQTVVVQGTSGNGKSDMVMNAPPEIEVHPETDDMRANGELPTCEPAAELPMAQRSFPF